MEYFQKEDDIVKIDEFLDLLATMFGEILNSHVRQVDLFMRTVKIKFIFGRIIVAKFPVRKNLKNFIRSLSEENLLEEIKRDEMI